MTCDMLLYCITFLSSFDILQSCISFLEHKTKYSILTIFLLLEDHMSKMKQSYRKVEKYEIYKEVNL